jgi:hypothetical protein
MPEVRNSLTRSVHVGPARLAVEVRATGALRQRVVAALEASGIALNKNGDGRLARLQPAGAREATPSTGSRKAGSRRSP